MKIFLTRKSGFFFRGIPSSNLPLCGVSVFELMKARLQAEEGEGEGERVVLDPVYPFLTRDELDTYLDGREGSYRFLGGYVIRAGCPMSGSPRLSDSLGQGLFTLGDYPSALSRARRESAAIHMAGGALVEEGAEVSYLAAVEAGAIIQKSARVIGRCFVGENAFIGGDSELTESSVGANTTVKSSYLIGAKVGQDCTVGPNAYLREGTVVQDGCRIGDFTELKNATVGKGTKIAHLSYVGDADLGEGVNVGCGVVFANFNGRKKSRVKVGDRCFLGSNCNLIAPLAIGDNVFVAAGTTLTKDLQTGDFCIGRCRETIKPDRAGKYYP